ncbi:MAG: DEAD/DEAH box helicase family protein [Spirochaetota bacterium]
MDETELDLLRSEYRRLKSLLAAHGIDWEKPLVETQAAAINKATSVAELVYSSSPTTASPTTTLTPDEKVAIFRRLFAGREDVFALRWESAKGGSSYSPACAHAWVRGICERPRIKCSECPCRELLPINDQVIYAHLSGKHTVGIYPLLQDDTCHFLAADFDEADWKGDALAFVISCREFGIPAGLEISRSGSGAHVWIFFRTAIPARDARRLGTALVSHTCERTRQLSLASYDRFFPNQDSLPKGGFGNLIALPLQKKPRGRGASVFVDDNFTALTDQWAFLASLEPLDATRVEELVEKVSGGRHPLDVAFVEEEEGRSQTPWRRSALQNGKLAVPLPKSLSVVLADRIYIARDEIPQPLSNRIIRLAAFQNPEYYKTQALRLSVWNKPRIISRAENYPKHIALPRGCLDALSALLAENGIEALIEDKRVSGNAIEAEFQGELLAEQEKAVEAMLRSNTGVLCAPTAFGKTIIAAALIARRKTATLVIVHRTDLARQWIERLGVFLILGNGSLGRIGGNKKKSSGTIDIAVMQSLARLPESDEIFERYGQVIVDECHHVSAFSFESVMKRFKAKYVLGLTATPIRRDGHHPIIFMQCGPIRHRAKAENSTITGMKVIATMLAAPDMPPEAGIQDVFRLITNDAGRNGKIVADILKAYEKGRKILVLTERTEHLENLRGLIGEGKGLFILHGRMKTKTRNEVLAALTALDEETPRIILATGKLVGEGFDHPALDTLVLAMPISWKGTLQQYAGRLHREHAGKTDVEIHDYVETDSGILVRMWEKRKKGYRAMGYTIEES